MTNNIVTVNVSQTIAPAPATLQQSGAFVSQGATTLATQHTHLLTQLSDLTGILKAAAANSTLTWSGSVVTVTTAAPHGFTTSDVISMTIAGVTPSGYNGTFSATITGASTFTYPLASDPGSETVPGTYVPASVAEVLAMGTTWFGQGSAVGVSVLELGAGTPAEGVTALTTYLTANPNSNYRPGSTGFFYAYLVPRAWAGEATFFTLLAAYESTTARTYFFSTATTGNYTSFTSVMKCAVVLVEAPVIPATEFSLAAAFYVMLRNDPSSTNKVTPYAFSFLFGVTAYPTASNSAQLAAFKAAFTNYVGTGAEGGLTNTILFWGTAKDGNDFTYWYSVDWVQINSDIAISNAVINGSNNPQAPLYYNQNGIDRLQNVEVSVMKRAISYGLALGQLVVTKLDAPTFSTNVGDGDYTGQVVVNADPFVSYSAENPTDYAIGKYGGLSVGYTPARGFTQIVFNVNVSNFSAT